MHALQRHVLIGSNDPMRTSSCMLAGKNITSMDSRRLSGLGISHQNGRLSDEIIGSSWKVRRVSKKDGALPQNTDLIQMKQSAMAMTSSGESLSGGAMAMP